MTYVAGKNTLQFVCQKCGLVSPHNEKCMRCGSKDKKKQIVPEIVRRRAKGGSINIRVGT